MDKRHLRSHPYLILIQMLLLFLIPTVFAANCGTSAIPYSLEVLPDGSTVLGCARPTCFGWDGVTGNWATRDAAFLMHNGNQDGFMRASVQQRPPYDVMHPSVRPQTSVCFPSAFCGPEQWVGGIFPPSNGTTASTMICCSYGPLMEAEFRGVAPVMAGQIAIGGEIEEQGRVASFDYLRNIQPIRDSVGNTMGYNVEMGRMRCTDPPAIVVPVAQQAVIPYHPPVQQVVYQPQTPTFASSYWCFAADSLVKMADGSEKRMDELKISDHVSTPTGDMMSMTSTPVESWLHRLPEQMAEFVVIETMDGQAIKLTARHFVYKSSCFKMNPLMVTAEEVSREDCLISATNGDLELVAVKEIRRKEQKGIFAPLTDSGKIIVDGVVASCYSEVSNDSLVRSLTDNFVQCDVLDRECHLKDRAFGIALDMVELLLPVKA